MKRAFGLLVVAFGLLLGPAAAAQESSEAGLTIRGVDTTSMAADGTVRVSALVTGGRPELTDFTLRENGRVVRDIEVVPLSATEAEVGIVLAIDTSESMLDNDAMAQAKSAAKQFVADRQPNERIAVVTFGGDDIVVSPFTTDEVKLNKAIDEIVPRGGTALWDGVQRAVGLFRDHPDMQANVVVMSDGVDTVSDASEAEAQSSALAAEAAVFVVGLQGSAFEERPLRSLAERTGGVYLSTADPTALRTLYDDVRDSLQNQFDVVYTSQAKGAVDLVLTVGDLRAEASANPGTVSRGVNTRPNIVEPSDGGFFTGTVGKALGGLFVFAAVALAIYAVVSLVVREESVLSKSLRPYNDDDLHAEGDEEDPSWAQTAFMQRAVSMTGTFAQKRGLLVKIERKLEEADLALRASEALLFYAAVVVVVVALVSVLAGSLIVGLIVLILAVLLPPAALNYLAKRRRKKFLTQLPDTLQLLSGSLRAGYSLMQGVEAVSQEVADPMGRELRRIMTESRLGRPLEDALEDAAQRTNSPDFAWAVMAIRIQREVGGNLSELLLTVAETMIARERLRREVSALTAEGRISAIVLGIMPPALGLAMWVINPEYISVLFDETIGNIMLIGSTLLAFAGFYWMKKTIEIEV